MKKRRIRLQERLNATGNWEIKCPECCVWFEEVNLGDAPYHGLGHETAVRAAFAGVAPGKLISN